MAQLGHVELIIILVIVVMIFGVSRIPELGSALGKSIRGFREAAEAPDDGILADPIDPNNGGQA